MARSTALVLPFALALAAAAPALAAGRSPEAVVRHHIEAGNKGDLTAVMSDYAANAVVLESGQAIQGKPAITKLLDGLLGPSAKQKLHIDPVKIWSEGDVGMVNWTANGGALKGSDSFLVRGGKIQVQAVFIQGR